MSISERYKATNQLIVRSDWRVARIGRICRSGMGQTILKEMLEEPGADGAVPVYSASEKDTEFGWLSNPQVQLKAGDLVIGARGSIGLTRKIDRDATCTQTTIWLKVDHPEVSGDYLYWCLLAHRERLFPFDKTAIPMLTVEQVRAGSVPLPPLPEQTAIVAFLDRETGKIDALVEEQKRLIDLLKEKRQAVISHAVTKGLDPKARMKPSGVDWLGDVPEHWEVLPLTSAFDLLYRYPTYFDIPYVEQGVPEVRGEAIKPDGTLEELSDQRFISDQTAENFPRTRLDRGDLVMSVRGTLGKIAVVDAAFEGANITANLLRLSPNRSRHSPEFLMRAMLSMECREQLNVFGSQTTIKTITVPQLAQCRLAFPPLNEQLMIARQVRASLGELDVLAAAARNSVSLLHERRSALISAAVTGKIHVRDLSAEEAAA